jgi:hypothetical protein
VSDIIPAIGRREVRECDGHESGQVVVTVWRGPTGRWFILRSSHDYSTSDAWTFDWGAAAVGDQPVTGDFDGDAVSDIAVWRGPSGTWYIRRSLEGFTQWQSFQWGSSDVRSYPRLTVGHG